MFSRALQLRYTHYLFTPEGPILPWSITLKVPAAISSWESIHTHWGEKVHICKKKQKDSKNLEKHVMQTSLVDEVSVTNVTLHK